MDQAELRDKVVARINELMDANEMFTTADVSHPIIQEDESVRHRHVRSIVNDLWADGTFSVSGYISSGITVYPSPGNPVNARLFHPDDPDVDPNEYTSRNQVLVRSGSSDASGSDVTRGFDMSGPDGDGDNGSDPNVVITTSTPSGAAVASSCQIQIQPKEGSLNIPRRLIKQAGWNPGDTFRVSPAGNHGLKVQPVAQGSPTAQMSSVNQHIDAEGRIRIHGSNLGMLNKNPGDQVEAMLVVGFDANDTVIEVR